MSADSNNHIAFTCPKSGRRYTIWLEDWDSIQAHMFVAKLAKDRREAKS